MKALAQNLIDSKIIIGIPRNADVVRRGRIWPIHQRGKFSAAMRTTSPYSPLGD